MITVLYSGNVGIGQDVDTVLRAAARLNGNGDLRLLIVGNGKRLSLVRELAAQLHLHNAEFRDPVPLHQLSALLVAGDIHVICQKPGTEGLLVPSKIYSTLAAGRPSLFVGPPNCEVSRIIRESRSGFVVDTGDIEGAMQALSTLAGSALLRQQMGQRAKQYYEEKFGRKRSVAKIIDVIERAGGNGQADHSADRRASGQIARGKSDSKPVAAALLASLLVFTLGVTHRVLLARLRTPTNVTAIDSSSLARLPMQIGDWVGQETPLDDEVFRGTNADAYVNRRYSRKAGSDAVSLYIACGVKMSEMVYHRPDVCYPASGWALTERCSTELTLEDGMKLPCTIFQFSSEGLSRERVIVLHYFIGHGWRYGSLSLLQSNLWRLTTTVDYIGQVQIVISSAQTQSIESATHLASAFAIDSGPFIAKLMDEIEKDRHSGEGSEFPQDK